MPSAESIQVVRYEENQAATWRNFLAASDNGTLFHDLDFLAYHPPGRFEEHHLMFYRKGELIALLPAAIMRSAPGQAILASPYGASVGGLVLPVHQPATLTMAICRSLQAYAAELGMAAIEMRLAPSCYNRIPGETLGFALAATGFTLEQRWICPHVHLQGSEGDLIEVISSKKRRSCVRVALSRDAVVEESSVERLPEFYGVLRENRARHQATPTHTETELSWLLERLPDRVRLYVCSLEGQVIGGTVMFHLNSRVVYSFYPCHDERFKDYQPPAIVLFHMYEKYRKMGFHYLDMGPTGWAMLADGSYHINEGNLFFKEQMGGVSYCRDAWKWSNGNPRSRSPESK